MARKKSKKAVKRKKRQTLIERVCAELSELQGDIAELCGKHS